MSEATLRPATVADVPEIQSVIRDGWTAAYMDILTEDTIRKAHTNWHTTERLKDPVTADDHASTVVDLNGQVIGIADALRPDPDSDPALGVVGVLYVSPAYWGDGYGSRLWNSSLAALREMGASRVSVRVFAENDVGRSFYESKGLSPKRTLEEELFGETVRSVEYESSL